MLEVSKQRRCIGVNSPQNKPCRGGVVFTGTPALSLSASGFVDEVVNPRRAAGLLSALKISEEVIRKKR